MKRLIITLVLAMAGLSLASAQTPETPASPAAPETSVKYEPIRKGDQFIRVGVGLGVPLFNFTPDGIENKPNLKLGGTATLGYSRFITSRIALGGDMSFSFNSTIGSNLYFYLPLTFKGTYVFVADRFHFPVSLGAGFALQTYSGATYFGPIVKPEIAAYFQYSQNWSFGPSLGWNMVSQIYKDGANNRVGNILDITASVRYHF